MAAAQAQRGARGAHAFRVGYLSSSRSAAVVQLTCAPPCACAPLTIASRAGRQREDTTSTTEFTPHHAARAPRDADGCTLRLALETDGAPFKLVALHVASA